MEPEDEFGTKKSILKLGLASDYYANVCPTIARHFIKRASELHNAAGWKEKPTMKFCSNCSTVWRCNNVKILLKPRMRKSRKITRLVEKCEKKALSKLQSKLVSLYKEGTNKLVYKCLVCNHLSSQEGASRPTKKSTRKNCIKSVQETTNKVKQNNKILRTENKKKQKPKKRSLLECLMNDRFNFEMATSTATSKQN